MDDYTARKSKLGHTAPGAQCVVRLDRLQFLADWSKERLPRIPGFTVRKDNFVRSQTSITTYRRVRTCQNPETGSELYIQYQPACPWLPPAKATLIGSDRRGLQRSEIEMVAKAFKKTRLLLVEVALDFPNEEKK